MERRRFTAEFWQEAVRQQRPGVSSANVAQDLRLNANRLAVGW